MIADINLTEEDQETEATIIEELRLDIGDKIVDNGNPVLKMLADLAASDDLLKTQRTIISYETGDGPLFRFLGRLLEVGETIVSSKPEIVAEAFRHLREQLTNEVKHSIDEKRPNKGIAGIGVPTIPVTDQKFFVRLMDDPYFLYKTLVNFYFPNLSSTMRQKYYRVLHWAHIKQEPNFVTWLAVNHEYEVKGKTFSKKGLVGAFNFIKATEPPIDEDGTNNRPIDGLIKKAMDDGKTFTAQKPTWLEECVDDFSVPFMMLGKVNDDGVITFYNSTTSDESKIKSAIQSGHGSLFPTDLVCDTVNPDINNANMITAIKNLIIYSGAPELILWQDSETKIFMMPLYDEWINDDKPSVKITDPMKHLVAMLTLFDAYDHKTQANNNDLILPDAVNVDGDFDYSIFEVGFVTDELEKLSAFRGNLRESFKLNNQGNILEFMGAQWMLASNRRPKRKDDTDIKLGRTRLLTIAPYGYRYISACRYYKGKPYYGNPNYDETYSEPYGELIASKLDFALARAVYRKWMETRKAAGDKTKPEYLTICAKNKRIGLWYENVVSENIRLLATTHGLALAYK